jgi:regulatory protein
MNGPPQGDGRGKAMNYALHLLSRRMLTEAQVRDKLRGKGATDEVVADVLSRLKSLGYLDDNAFAETYLRSRARKKGALALRRELLSKGVPEEVAEAALAKLSDEAQLEAALAVLAKEAWRLGSDRRKAYAFLARRGFPGEVVMAALERGFGEREP